MNIGLIDVDGRHFPNLALCKIAAWHKARGDTVEWYSPLFSKVDQVYASKVFTFSPDYQYFPSDCEIVTGGTGYRNYTDLPYEIDRMKPDYALYPEFKFAFGFLSRGCIRHCPWCVVPRKEGGIRQYDDIERVAQNRKHVVLMDNNFLANDRAFIREQLEKSVRFGLKLDFNQGLDARLVDAEIASWLAKCKWRDMNGNNAYIRFSCDTQSMIVPVQVAIGLLRNAGYNGHIFIYFLAKDVDETLDRIMTVTLFDEHDRVNPFCMPFRNLDGDGEIVNKDLKRLARWCNMASIRKSCKFRDYKG